MRIAVIDGQGGGIGRTVIARLRAEFGNRVHIIALGTNSQATANMLKSGADSGATGENAVSVTSHKVELIIGPLAILMANSMMGEITPRMAENVADSSARKIIIPMNLCNVHMVGSQDLKMAEAMVQVSDEVERLLRKA